MRVYHVKRVWSGVAPPCLTKASVFQTQRSVAVQLFKRAISLTVETITPSERRSHFVGGGFHPLPQLLALLFTLFLFASPVFAQPPAPTTDAHSKARAQLREIVSRSEFKITKSAQKNPLQESAEWLRQKWDELTKWFNKLFSQTPKIISNSFVVWVFIGLFLVLAMRLVIHLFKNRYQAPKLRNAPLAFTEEIERFPLAEEWLERAKGYAEAHDHAKAYRAAFVALLLRLDAESVVPFEKQRTNGEYLQLLLKSPALFRALKPAFWQFDTHCYGGRPALPADYAQTIALYEKLPSLARRTEAGRIVEEAR